MRGRLTVATLERSPCCSESMVASVFGAIMLHAVIINKKSWHLTRRKQRGWCLQDCCEGKALLGWRRDLLVIVTTEMILHQERAFTGNCTSPDLNSLESQRELELSLVYTCAIHVDGRLLEMSVWAIYQPHVDISDWLACFGVCFTLLR